MPFYDGWNPDRGGSSQAGEKWILENLGKRPTDGKYQLHVINKQIGFVPGNLMWMPVGKHKREELLEKTLARVQELELKLAA